MKRICFLLKRCIVFFSLGLHAQLSNASDENMIIADANNLLQKNSRLFFIENKGQWHSDVLYLCRMGGLDAWITKYGINYSFYKLERRKEADDKDAKVFRGKFDHDFENQMLVGHRVLFELQGHNPNPIAEGRKKQPGYHNYFIGNDPSKHATYVGLYSEVVVKEVYPGIDIRYYFDEGYLRFDFVVHPGADPSRIRFKLRGPYDAYCEGGRDLIFSTRFGSVEMGGLRTFQENGQEVSSRFVREGEVWRIGMGRYVKNMKLVIDPLIYSTFIGGSGVDDGMDIAVDAGGHAYVTGRTISTIYDITPGSFQTTNGGTNDVFVTKLNPSGTGLVYSTYIGGISDDQGYGIAIDASGHAYVTGRTSSPDYDITTGAFQTTNSGSTDVFVTKLNPSGTGLVYSTYIGGTSDDFGYGITIAASGHAYVTGYTKSTDYDITPGAFQTTHGGGTDDVFMTKFDISGTGLVYSTYIGGNGNDWGYDIAIDAGGNAYVTGFTGSTDYDITPGAFQTTNGGGTDVFVTKLNPSGTGLVYSTYIGGSGGDGSFGIAIDAGGHAYVTGFTGSTDYDITTGAFQTTNGGIIDVFVTKLNPSGTGLVYSTYIGGNGDDRGFDIAIDAGGHAYVTGFTGSTDYDITTGAFQTMIGGLTDVFVMKLNPSATGLVYSTFIGGSNNENANGISVDGAGNVYVTGSADSPDYDVTSGAFQVVKDGSYDVFVTKLCPEPLLSFSLTSSSTTTNQSVCTTGSIVPITFSVTGASTVSFGGLPPGVNATYSSGLISISGSPTVAGNYVYSVNIMNGCADTTTTGFLNVLPSPQYTNISGNPSQTVCKNQSIIPIIYSYSSATLVSVQNLPPGVNFSTNVTNPQLHIYGTPTVSGLFVYTVTLTVGPCNSTFTETIHVLPTLSHTLLSSPSSTNQNVCVGSSIQPITYTTSGGLTNISYNNIPSGVNVTENAGLISISGTPTLEGNYNFTINLISSCGLDSIKGYINVLSQPTLSTIGGSLFQNVCVGSSIQPILLNVSPSSTYVNVSGLPTGVTFYNYSNGGIISGTPIVPPSQNEFTITVQNLCGQVQQTGTIVVNSNSITVVQISPLGTENQTLCEGANILPISYSLGGISSIIVNGLPAGVGYTLFPGTCVIEGTPIAHGNFTYELKAIGCNSNVVIKQGTIEVMPSINISLVSTPSSTNQTVCVGKPIEVINYSIYPSMNVVQVQSLPDGVGYVFDIINQHVHISGIPTLPGTYSYSLTSPGTCINNGKGEIKVENCNQISVPTGLAGNGVWHIENIEQYPDNEVLIFGRWGNKIASIKGYNNKDKAWGSMQYPINVPEGTYYYIISVGDKKIKGYVELIR